MVGVEATIDGARRTIRARGGVVLTAGGFIFNRALVEEHCPAALRCNMPIGNPFDDGRGIAMGEAVGAQAVGLDRIEVGIPFTPPRSLVRGIVVNAKGERFLNEDTYAGRLGQEFLLRQDGQVYFVHDDSTFAVNIAGYKPKWVAETAAELEDQIGLPAGSLQATLDRYNESARAGADPDFHKASEWVTPLEPPYGVVDLRVEKSFYAPFTLGGLGHRRRQPRPRRRGSADRGAVRGGPHHGRHRRRAATSAASASATARSSAAGPVRVPRPDGPPEPKNADGPPRRAWDTGAMPPAIPDDPPYDVPPLLELERARLLDLLTSLDAAEWRRATRCPGWSVLDLAAHLLGDDLGYLAGHRDGHHGIRPPVGTDEDAFIDWLDGVQDDWVRSARRLSPTLVTELLGWTGPQVVAAIEAEDPTERAASVSWASTTAVPRWLDHARELTERWIHRNQVLDAVDRPVDLRPDLVGPVLEALRWAYPFRLAPHRRARGAAVTFDIGDRCRWRLVSDGDGWAFAPAGRASDDVDVGTMPESSRGSSCPRTRPGGSSRTTSRSRCTADRRRTVIRS